MSNHECRRGGTGRRTGLKILRGLNFVPVRFRSPAVKRLTFFKKYVSLFYSGFSQLKALEFFVFRKMIMPETGNHLLCGWCSKCLYHKNHLSDRIELFKLLSKKGKVILMAHKKHDMAHTKWMCKYHIVFTPKYRRKMIYNQYKESIRDILKTLCGYKGVEILEGHLMPDHIHMLVSIPPKYSISSFMGYLKGKSALMIFDKHANLKYKYGNRHFWAEGYYVSTVGLNEATVRKYIQEQEKYDIAMDKLSVKEYEDPFKGEPVLQTPFKGGRRVKGIVA